MNQILMGVEVFLTTEQIRDRLTSRQEKRMVESQEEAVQQLKEFEDKILSADSKIQQLEEQLFIDLKQAIIPFLGEILKTEDKEFWDKKIADLEELTPKLPLKKRLI